MERSKKSPDLLLSKHPNHPEQVVLTMFALKLGSVFKHTGIYARWMYKRAFTLQHVLFVSFPIRDSFVRADADIIGRRERCGAISLC